MSQHLSPDESGAAARLLEHAGFHGEFELLPLPGGGNNRVFRILSASGSNVLLKAYFSHPSDQRDRLGAEFAFASFAWTRGSRRLAQPLGCDRERRLGLYEYIAGRHLHANEVDQAAVAQALDFYRHVNAARRDPEGAALPLASEAFFSLEGHLQRVAQRLETLRSIDASNAQNRDAARFVAKQLLPAWAQVKAMVLSRAGTVVGEPVAPEDRRLSPSDFGFHNALIGDDGRLRFIDFEYAGWDDPAKTVCDFFCQQKVPVPLQFLDTFAQGIAADLARPELLLARSVLLMPVYRIKWACIVLNEFVPSGGERRQFALGKLGSEERKSAQLGLARRLLGSVLEETG